MLSEQAVVRRTIVKSCPQLCFYSSVFAVFSVSGLVGFAAVPADANPLPDPITQSAASVIYVNSAIGSDNASGQAQSPLRTITVALDRAGSNTTIVLAPGAYSVETGEVFPIQLKPSVAIQGDPRDRGQSIIIRGGDFFLSRTFARQNVTIVGANRSTLSGVTITNPNPQGYGLWTESSSPLIVANTFTGSGHDGVSIVGNSAPILRNNYLYQNGANGITIYGTSRPELQENIIERTGFGVNIAQNAAPKLVGNRITQNKDGIVIQGNAQPILRNNVIDSNDRDGVVAIAQSRPNLGTSEDPGNNTFLSNRQFDINALRSTQTLPAFGNQLSARTVGRLDLSGVASLPEPTTNVASSAGAGQSRSFARLPIARPVSTNSGAIEIPVPAALTSSMPMPQRPIARPAFPRPTMTSAVLPIAQSPFPSASMPIARSAFPRPMAPLQTNTVIRSSTPMARTPQADMPQPRRMNLAGVLPVPRTAPPIGNTSGTSVRVWQGGRSNISQAKTLGFRFRVIVRAAAASDQAQVRSMVPNAFSLRGRGAMQAGAFRDRAEADELLQSLLNQGLQASIEQI